MKYEELVKKLKDDAVESDLFNEEEEEWLSMIIGALEKQMPKKPYKDNESGEYEKEHCPSRHRSLFPNDHHCECGQAIDWSDDE